MAAEGLVGYLSSDMPPDRVSAVVARAPWRGTPTTTVASPFGAVVALGTAQASRFGHICVALHGRIDNLAELANKLNSNVNDPCAVLAAAYLRDGAEFADAVRGDFAVLILDEQAGVLLGARDWIGARPLFWGQEGSLVAFGSEVKQVLALLDQPYRLNEDALQQYENRQDLAFDATFASGIAAVLPNGQVRAKADGTARSWRRRLEIPPVGLELVEAASTVRDLLEVAVQRRTAGAHRLGALLSGGMDSTAVLATAASLANRGVGPPVASAFTIAYPDVLRSDETRYARQVAERWDIPWCPVPVHPRDLLAGLDRVSALHDGPPFPGFAAHSQVLMPAVENAQVDVLLSGQGGDFWLSTEDADLRLALLRHEWTTFARWAWAYGKWTLNSVMHRRRPQTGGRQVLSGLIGIAGGERAEEYFERAMQDYWWRAVLEAEEREGMRRGIRVEFPFCDRDLAMVLAGLPPSVRTSPSLTKRVTREAMRGLLPESVRMRTDVTYANPVVRAALGQYDGDRSIGVEIAHRYGKAWRDYLEADVTREQPI